MSSIAHFNLNLRGLCTQGRLKEALNILLTANNPPVDSSTYLHLLQACIDKKALSEGKQIHSHINDWGLTLAKHTFLHNKLIHMYDKCGSIVDARNVFHHLTQPDIFSWNMIIAGYARQGFPREAFTLFHQMQQTTVQPDHFTFSTILPVCASTASLNHGLQIHGKIIRYIFHFNIIVMNALTDMYVKCGSVHKASALFDKMSQRSVVSWTVIISGYAQNDHVEKALEIFQQMQLTAVKPNSATFASILPACAKMGALEQGMEIHQKIIGCRFISDIVVGTALVDMYAKCGSLQKANRLFNQMPERNVVSWNAMIVGYAQNGIVDKALEHYRQMQLTGLKPNSATFASILPACAEMGALEHGMEIHQKIIKSGFLWDVVEIALIDMYAKCGSIQKARELFDKIPHGNVVLWNAMIAGYSQNGVLDEALKLFSEMPQRNVVSWTTIIAGYVQNGLVEKAVEIFKEMQLADVKPNSATFASILPACAKTGALEQGMEIHQKIVEGTYLSNVVVTSLMDMYAKCGSIQKARVLFDKMHHPDAASWNAMIAGYAMHGYSKDALKLFELMKHSGTDSDHVSFICILFACGHVGAVEDGCKLFNHMINSNCITPSMDHYTCMVDLLGRAGYLEEALNFIIKMATKPDAFVWMCLLGTCRSHKNIGLGEFVATLLFELDPKNAAPYVLLSNMYAEVGSWSDIQKVRKLMKDKGIKKIPGCSWIGVH